MFISFKHYFKYFFDRYIYEQGLREARLILKNNVKHVKRSNNLRILKRTDLYNMVSTLQFKFYQLLLKRLCLKNKLFLHTNYVHPNKGVILKPLFDLKSKFFTDEMVFKDVLNTHNVQGFFMQHFLFKKNFYNNTFFTNKDLLLHSHNFYVYCIKNDNLKSLITLSEDKEYQNLIAVKFI